MKSSIDDSGSSSVFHAENTADLFPAALATLATEINAEHEAAERTARKAIDHARAAGYRLLLAKAQVDHGQWLPWLSANCPALAARTARSYMQLARNWAILETKTADSANLSIDAALKLLNAPEPLTGDIMEPAYHDRITAPLLPATPAPPVSAAAVAVMLAELPEAEQRIVVSSIPAITISVANTIRRARGELKRSERLARYPAAPLDTESVRIIARDIRLLTADDIASESVDCIITDPPYPKDFIELFDDLGALAARVLKPGGSLVAMTGQAYLPDYLNRLSQHLTYRWTLAYHTPGHNTQAWGATVINAWKPLLWFTKGPWDAEHWINDFVVSPLAEKDKEHHDWGQSLCGMTAIVERFTNPGDVVLDPFLGGGTTGLVCRDLQRPFIGVERDAGVAQQAAGRIQATATEAQP